MGPHGSSRAISGARHRGHQAAEDELPPESFWILRPIPPKSLKPIRPRRPIGL